jgi:hypothetical protein
VKLEIEDMPFARRLRHDKRAEDENDLQVLLSLVITHIFLRTE